MIERTHLLAKLARRVFGIEGVQQPGQTDQAIQRRWCIDKAKGQARSHENPARGHRWHRLPFGFLRNSSAKALIEADNRVGGPRDQLFGRHADDATLRPRSFDHIDCADALDDLGVDRTPRAGLETFRATREINMWTLLGWNVRDHPIHLRESLFRSPCKRLSPVPDSKYGSDNPDGRRRIFKTAVDQQTGDTRLRLDAVGK